MAAHRSPLVMPRALRALFALILLGIAVCTVQYGLGRVPSSFVDNLTYDSLLVGSAVLCLARAALHRFERRAWLVMGVAMLAYAAGNVLWSLLYTGHGEPPYPSLSDGLWLAFYPLAYLAIVMLLRARLPHLDARLWLDGMMALLVLGALSASFIVEPVLETTGGDLWAVVTNLAYPVFDTILAGLVLGAMVAGRGRLDRTWLCVAAGILVFAAVDGLYAYQVAVGSYVEGQVLDVFWPAGTLLMGLAAWQPAVRTARGEYVPTIVVPVSIALLGLALMIFDHFKPLNDVALALVAAALLSGTARSSLTHRLSRANLIRTRRQANTDVLTGLGSRLALMHALEGLAPVEGEEEEPRLLLLFDLDGFKNYNDSYGHPAGDALLARLGSRLQTAVAGHGSAYRMGGDEFCVLAPWSAGRDPQHLIEITRAALVERGEGFEVGASCGHALLPEDGADAAEALRVADRRLYAEKNSGRVSARMQSTRVLRRALDEWDADLGSHGQEVGVMAGGVARRLGLDDDAVDRVVAAAELHDVGKIALPQSILHKRGPLDEEEWAYMRRHTLIGERIVQAAPALVGVGQLIRSSHERWDGRGYPDGLAGDEIPLGSQIVFICDAFSAMTTDRSYRRGMPEAAALAELRRHAGTQFAPAAVEAFAAERAACAALAAVAA